MLATGAGEICAAVQGRLLCGEETTPVRGVSTDSRAIKPGMLFIALKGERFDGHDFIGAALAAGAAAAVGEHFPAGAMACRQPEQALIQVENTYQALQQLAAYHRQKNFTGPLIAVTGSSGKTTTKNLVAAVLSSGMKVLKTPGNFNNEIGLPLTLLSLAPEHEAAVVEMAMRGRGEIAALCAIARPTMGIITNIGTAHLERLGSVAAIAAAKGELLAALPPEGVAILNGDDEWCRKLAATCHCRVVFYGLKSKADVMARDITVQGTRGTAFTAVLPAGEVRVQIPVPGRHNIYNTLAALAAGYSLNLAPDTMATALEIWPAEDLRQELRPGPGGCLIFNDAYNANPDSMQAALQVLAALPGRRVAVLGDMLELGPMGPALHREVGRFAAGAGLFRLVTVGELAREIAAGAVAAGMPPGRVFSCSSHGEAAGHLLDLGAGDVVLFKGSRRAGVEQVLAIWEGEANG
ncbi:UDP-N-acetylmuramoyl-tripeptide--D-alanyl-D-alanine ligase [Moorella sulfitireducens]|uniref:UDP-N-acetylmuramoyl-tripeptide--D-alanyl-D- alanine ligase n=1 Tax=Neomoorella sulfitireducens TaxID=2972948 RepID=UPI0021ACEBEA|nr:UDP-N-acetylmuramoyl-tripeptide--D-alanyl-D-alanine ligase [Moorella sulfitireducens]